MTDRAHDLATAALEHPLAQVLHTLTLRKFVLSRIAGSPAGAAEAARGAWHAPDGGASMADAAFAGLSADARAQLERFAADALSRQLLIAATWLVDAAEELGAVDVEISPEVVVVMAQTFPVVVQRAREQLAAVDAAGGDPTDDGESG